MLRKGFEAKENIKILKFEGHWANSKLAFVSKEDPLKNALGNIKKSKKVRQYRKALITAFANFWVFWFFSTRETGWWTVSLCRVEVLLLFFLFTRVLSLKSFGNSGDSSYITLLMLISYSVLLVVNGTCTKTLQKSIYFYQCIVTDIFENDSTFWT